MKKFNFIIVVLFLFSVSVVPVFTQAATKAGAKPGSFFYFFDRALEKTSLFFTFSSEKKAKKALEYAEERLAEAEELVKENKQEDAKKTIENYQENISLAEMEAKEIKDEAKTNDLLSIIASSTSKNQEVLERVLEKVPEEAKEGVQKAIEVSNKGDEGSTEEIEAPKKEVKAVEKTDNGLKEEGESKEKKEIINKKEEIIKKDDQANEIEKLKKEVEALKQKAEKQPISSQKSSLSSINNVPLNTVVCNGKYWTTCDIGQKFYCPEVGDAQCLVENTSSQNNDQNDLVQNQQTYVISPTPQQLTDLRHFCLSDSFLNSVCNGPSFMPGYFTNLKFREGIDDLIVEYNKIISEQQKQQIAKEKETMSCLMDATPESERILDPSTQYYLRQLRCGTATELDKANYELHQVRSSMDDLKYKLDSKISFPSLLLDSVQLPSLNKPRWEVRWDDSGGTITTSDGGIYKFHCEDNSCRSY